MMGVPVGQSEGDHPVTLGCRECGSRYETDETMGNDCPACGFARFRVLDDGEEA